MNVWRAVTRVNLAVIAVCAVIGAALDRELVVFAACYGMGLVGAFALEWTLVGFNPHTEDAKRRGVLDLGHCTGCPHYKWVRR